jgi:hypothetical protein
MRYIKAEAEGLLSLNAMAQLLNVPTSTFASRVERGTMSAPGHHRGERMFYSLADVPQLQAELDALQVRGKSWLADRLKVHISTLDYWLYRKGLPVAPNGPYTQDDVRKAKAYMKKNDYQPKRSV